MRGWRAGLLAIGLLLGTASIAHAATGSPVLERGNGPEPATLDAHRCPDIACANILRDLYEGLVTEDAQGRAIPGMATHWTVSEDGLVWTFHLRDGLRWSNGEPLDAGQIVASFRRAFAPDTAAPHAALFDALHQARAVQAGRQPPDALGVAAPDPRTVVFRLERSAPMTVTTTAMKVAGPSCGMMMFHSIDQPRAPSMRAASTCSGLMLFSPVRNRIMQ